MIASRCRDTLAESIITRELAACPGVTSVAVEQPTGTVTVSYGSGCIALPTIRDTLDAVEYPVIED